MDAKDIAKQFEDRGAGDTTGNNAMDKTEKAENSNVQVVVDDDGNYKVIVKKDIDHTVEIPDTWGEVKIDLMIRPSQVTRQMIIMRQNRDWNLSRMLTATNIRERILRS